MTGIDIHPYYYPTTVVVVDDSHNFLVNFSLHFDERLACRLYDSPVAALTDINASSCSPAYAKKSPVHNLPGVAHKNQQSIVELDISALLQEAANPERFSEQSVVIVDYDMPGVNGVEFCKLIKNKNIRKILMSGVADEKLAVKAFNEGVIDKFILKSDSAEVDRINDYIFKLQSDYFAAKASVVKNMLDADAYGFLLQPVFVELFRSICKEHAIAEYYLSSSPNGFVLFSESGKAYSLIIYVEEEFDVHADVIKDQGGPLELYNLTRQRQAIPFFGTSDGYYTSEVEDWREFVHPAQRLHAALPYYYALIGNPSHISCLVQDIYQYNQYLETVDNALKDFC